MLSTSPSFPISSHIPPASTLTAASLAVPLSKTKTHPAPRVLYRLAAVVCHYGQHSFGHYVCFRRKPRGAGRVVPPRLDDGPMPGRGWLRVSDDTVREVGIETVLQEGAGAFMLYYERVVGEDEPGRPWTGALVHSWETGTSSDAGSGVEGEKAQETHRVAEDDEKHAPGEEQVNVVVPAALPSPAVIKARVVRSVSLGPEEILGGTSVKQEVEAEVVDPESRPSEESLVGVDEPLPVASSVELPSAKVPSSLPEPAVVDEPPISLPRTVDLRA